MAIDLSALLVHAKERGASDLHLSSGQPPLLRLHGSITPLEMPPITPQDTYDALGTIMSPDQLRVFHDTADLDFGFEIPGVARYRANIFMQRRGPGAVFRLIPSKVLSLDSLQMPKALRDLASREKGLVVVTGPTGSGKSTTLAAMVDFVNETRSGHIITVEDPIEFVHESKKCLVNQREVGRDTKTFASALRAALREDPDIVLVGELRDLETTSLAISAAETGHLVFATLHTNSAAKTIDRIIDIYPGDQQSQVRAMLSESLLGVVAQTLVQTADGKGRAAAVEILVGVPAIRNLIREDKITQIASMIQTGMQHGMQTLEQSLKDLVKAGRISQEAAIHHSGNPRLFESSGSMLQQQAPNGGMRRAA